MCIMWMGMEQVESPVAHIGSSKCNKYALNNMQEEGSHNNSAAAQAATTTFAATTQQQ